MLELLQIINDDDKKDQANNGICPIDMSGCLHFKIVTTKFSAPKTEEIPKIFKPKIHMSAAGPGAVIIEYGGVAYQVKSANPNQIRTPLEE